MCTVSHMQPQNPAGQDAGNLVEALLRGHVRRVGRIGAQRHRALLPEMLTRPRSVVVIRDLSPAARRRWLLDTYAMGFRSRARGGREQPPDDAFPPPNPASTGSDAFDTMPL